MSWEENIRRVDPYVAGEQPGQAGVIKLNTNECPYPPSPKVTDVIRQLETDMLRLYPDMNAQKLVDALADYYHVKPEQIFIGVGSDDVLAMSFMTLMEISRFCFLILLILFMMCGRMCSESHSGSALLMKTSGLKKKTTLHQMEVLLFPIPMHLQGYWSRLHCLRKS